MTASSCRSRSTTARATSSSAPPATSPAGPPAARSIPRRIDEAAITGALDTAGVPDPDLLIRTSGEQRISNFLLWQCAYSEFVFLPICWPDFDREQLLGALDLYVRRERRFGGLMSQPAE